MERTLAQHGAMAMATNQTMTSAVTSSAGKTGSDLKSADDDLRHYVEEMLHFDKRFVGMSAYVYNINLYWSSVIPTACAGHGFIFFNPEFWDKLDTEKKKSIISHEIWHLILKHLDRMEGYDPDLHNQAADHVINNMLVDEGFVMGPNVDFGGIKGCCDPRFKGMSTEQVYRILEQEKQQQQSMDSGGEPGKGSASDGSGGFPHPTKDQIEDLIQEALEGSGVDLQQQQAKASEEAKQAQGQVLGGQGIGDQAGSINREITYINSKEIKEASYEEIFEPWLIDPLSGGKRTYMRPSRRQAKGGLRLKGKYPKRGKKNRLTRLVYALDVSGSISASDARMFLESAATIKDKLNPKEMIVILWDTRIVFEKTFREDEPIRNINVRAGGGTCLGPVYKRVAEINPEALVIFTDLAVTIPPKPSWETIWFVPNKHHIYGGYLSNVTYGEVYQVPEN